MTYPSVVSRDTVCIGFLMLPLNVLYIIDEDIQIVLLEAPTQEKILFYADDEWKAYKDRVVVGIHALYGLKYIALQLRNHLSEILGNKLGFRYSLADPDLWYKASTSPDGFDYYSYIIVYMDDLLIINKFPHRYM